MAMVLRPIRGPRVILLLLAAWDLLGAATQLLADNALFSLQGQTVDGVLAARGFSGALVVPAIVYIYALRHPDRYHQVWWLALMEQVVAIASYFYHLGADHYGLEDAAVPIVASLILLVLVVLKLLPLERPEAAGHQA